VKIVTSMAAAARSAAKISTCSVAFEECGFRPFDAWKILEKWCTGRR
jgi:hypothetical protein